MNTRTRWLRWSIFSAVIILSAALFMLRPGQGVPLFWALIGVSLVTGALALGAQRWIALGRELRQGWLRIPQWVLLIIALVTMILCQLVLARDVALQTHELLFVALSLSGLAVGVFASWRAGPLIEAVDTVRLPDLAQVARVRVRWRWLVGSFALAIYGAWRTAHSPEGVHAFEYLAVWLLSMVAFARAVRPDSPVGAPLDRRELALLVGLFVAALLLRGLSLEQIPDFLDQDEARFSVNGAYLHSIHFYVSPFTPGEHSHPNFNYLLVGLSSSLFGNTLTGSRVPSVIFGAFSLPALYLLGKELFGWQGGLVAALFALTWPFHLFFSRMALNQSGDALFTLLPFLFFLRGLRRASVVDYALCGFSLGAAQLFYHGGRIVPFVLLCFIAYLALRQPRPLANPLVRQWRLMAWAALAAFIVSLPQNYFLLYNRLPVTDRAEPSVLVGGHLDRYLDKGGDLVSFLRTQTASTFLALYVPGDNGGWYGNSSNLMGPFGGPPLLVGIVVCGLFLWRRPRWALPMGWLLSMMILFGVLAITPPHYQRLFPIQGAFALLLALGVIAVASAFAVLLGDTRWRDRIVVGIAGLLCALNGVYFFGAFVPERGFIANRPNWMVNLIARDAQTALANGQQVVILTSFLSGVEHSPVVKYFLFGKPYIMIEDPRPIRNQPGVFEGLDVAKPFRFIIARDRALDMQTLMQLYPGGVADIVILPQDGTIAYFTYESKTGIIPLPRTTP